MDIHNIFLQAHRGFAYLEILLVVLFILALVLAFAKGGYLNNFLKKITMFVMIFFHIQFLLGIIMLFGTSGFMNVINELGMGGIMKNSELRFTYIEHPFSMLIAAVLMTIVNRKMRSSEKITGAIIVLSLITLVLFGYALPWDRLMGN